MDVGSFDRGEGSARWINRACGRRRALESRAVRGRMGTRVGLAAREVMTVWRVESAAGGFPFDYLFCER